MRKWGRKPNHTPGPWVADYQGHIGWTVRTIDDGKPADFIVPAVGSGVDEAANARLLAAAPELLEALKALMAYATKADSKGVKKAMEAIKKAGG
jgi:hypothetical protein